MRIAALILIPALALVAACDSAKKAPPAPTAGGAGPGAASGQLPEGHPPTGGMGAAGMGGAGMGAGGMGAGGMGAGGMGAMGMGAAGTGAPAGAVPVAWDVPEGWTSTRPANQMRIANFPIAEVQGSPIEVVVFGGIGGSAEQNFERWIGQFQFADEAAAKQAAKITETTVNGLTIKRLDVTGPFGGGMAADPNAAGANYRMLAVVVEGTASPVQVKLVGPAAVIAEHESEFNTFIASMRPAR